MEANEKPSNSPRYPATFPYSSALVIGGLGFIGSRIAADLRRLYDIPVVVLDDCSRDSPATVGGHSGIFHRRYDAMNPDHLKIAILLASDAGSGSYRDGRGGVAVFHMAARAENSPEMTRRSMMLNCCAPTMAFRGLLSSDRFLGSCMVFASSFAVYGGLPYGEKSREGSIGENAATTAYGRSKVIAECSLFSEFEAARSIDRPLGVLRFSNVIGVGEQVGDMRTADPSGGLVAATLRTLRHGSELRLPVKDALTPSRYPYRDFIDVRDVSSAAIATAAAIRKTGDVAFTTMNVCSGESRCIRDFAVGVCGSAVVPDGVTYPDQLPRSRVFDPDYSCGCNDRISKVVGWSPSISFEDSLKWIRESVRR